MFIYQRRHELSSNLIIENICLLVIAEGLAESESDFCERWLCRGEGYMRTLRFRRLRPSADALATCADRLGYYANIFEASDRSHSKVTGKNLRLLQEECESAIRSGARAQWQGFAVH
jgi:hypothetical protein